MNRIEEEIKYIQTVKSTNSIWDIPIPDTKRKWELLSFSGDLDIEYIKKYKQFLCLELLISNEKIKKRKKLSDDYGAEIDWTKVAIIAMYRLKNAQKPKLTMERKKTLKLLKERKEKVKWNNLVKPYTLSSINEDFLNEFYIYINWIDLIDFYPDEISDEMIDFLNSENIIDWRKVSVLQNLSMEFIIKNADKIDWNVFLKTHEWWQVPIECRNREDLLIEIRNNPDLINLRGDKEAIAETNARLKRYVWIDRTAGVEGHYQDDTGLWIDTLRGEAADDAENLESDLEHNPENTYGETSLEIQSNPLYDEEEFEL